MKPLEYFGVAAQQVTQNPTHVLKIEGDFLGSTADRYLQVHDSEIAPAALAVPLRQWKISQSSPFFQTFSAGELPLAKGLYIAVSDTSGTFTASADTMDLRVELTDPEQPSGATIVGDKTTEIQTLVVWNNGAGPKRLYRLSVTEVNNTTGYVFLYRSPTDPNPLYLGKIAALATRQWDFGQGLEPTYKDGSNVTRNGCWIEVTEDLARTTITLNQATMLAEYK
jgi:hypothetical protein